MLWIKIHKITGQTVIASTKVEDINFVYIDLNPQTGKKSLNYIMSMYNWTLLVGMMSKADDAQLDTITRELAAMVSAARLVPAKKMNKKHK